MKRSPLVTKAQPATTALEDRLITVVNSGTGEGMPKNPFTGDIAVLPRTDQVLEWTTEGWLVLPSDGPLHQQAMRRGKEAGLIPTRQNRR